jgi:DNA-directed RNA polymerase specialized sigma24 family protein
MFNPRLIPAEGWEDSVESEALLRIEIEQALGYLEELEPRLQRVVSALYGLGCGPLSHEELAHVLGTTPGGVLALERRALRALADRFEGMEKAA